MSITIHSGSKQIGATCLEIKSNKTRILVDFGYPLEMSREDENLVRSGDINKLVENKLIPDIKGIYKEETPDFDGILLSHAHLDHYGFFNLINGNIPIYTNRETIELLKINNLFNRNKYSLDNIIEIKAQETFSIGDINITPYKIGHSVAGALSFLINVNKKNVFYTGDFRAHGRTQHRFENLVENLPKDIDYLILEGTNISRDVTSKTEEDLQKDFENEFTDFNGLSGVCFSTINIDRFVTIFKACLNSKKTFVIDPYNAYILENLHFISKKLPRYYSNNIAVFSYENWHTKKLKEIKELSKYKTAEIDFDEILQNKSKYVLKLHYGLKKQLEEEKELDKTKIIYSMWKGYFEKDVILNKVKDNVSFIHTSGHADVAQLKKLVNALNPSHVLPIHTEHAEKYKDFFKCDIILDNRVLF